MTHLQLLVFAIKMAAITGTTPTAVTGLSGDQDRMVDHLNDAWLHLQQERRNWAWKHTTVTKATVAADNDYVIASSPWNLTDLGTWDREALRLDDGTSADDRRLEFWLYEDWINIYGYKELASPTQSSIPTSAIWREEDATLLLYPSPDDAYNITFRYWKSTAEMGDATYTPTLPSDFHRMIAWYAVFLFAKDQGDSDLQNNAMDEYRRYHKNLLRWQTKHIRRSWGVIGGQRGLYVDTGWPDGKWVSY